MVCDVTMDNYLKALQKDKEITLGYYKKSLIKTEQHKLLEKLLKAENTEEIHTIADIACGGGTLSYHLRKVYRNTQFSLLDNLPEAIETAKSVNGEKNCSYFVDDIYDMPFEDNYFDLVFCWQTLSWLDNPQKALCELTRICKPKGKIYVSSLFNLDFDVDIYARVFDYTRVSALEGQSLNYNTYSKHTVRKWLTNKVTAFDIIIFKPEVDFYYEGRGLGTFTKKCGDERLQISGGMLMNWGILIITK